MVDQLDCKMYLLSFLWQDEHRRIINSETSATRPIDAIPNVIETIEFIPIITIAETGSMRIIKKSIVYSYIDI